MIRMKDIYFILAIGANIILFYHGHLNSISAVGRLGKNFHIVDIAVNGEDIEVGSRVHEGCGLFIEFYIVVSVHVQLEAGLIVCGYENACHVFLFRGLLKIRVITIDI